MRSVIAGHDTMARPLRNHVPGISLHVFNRGNNRTSIFDEDIDREWFLAMIERAFERRDVSVHNFVLMTTHFHLMVTPTREHALSKAMHEVGHRYAEYFNRKYTRTGGLWEGRYHAVGICDDSYPLVCQRYIEQNPVRAKMVSGPDGYRWSSYRMYALGEPCSWLVPHGTYLALGRSAEERRAAYRALCAEPVPGEAIVRLRRPWGRTGV
jgi:putative transposase